MIAAPVVDDTRELISAAQFGAGVAAVSMLAALAALGLWMTARRKGAAARPAHLLTALGGVALYPLWLVYNLIEDFFGLDSIIGLLANLALFCALGLAFGTAARRMGAASAQAEENPGIQNPANAG